MAFIGPIYYKCLALPKMWMGLTRDGVALTSLVEDVILI